MLQDKNTRFDGGSRRYGAERVDRVGTRSDVAKTEKETGVVLWRIPVVVLRRRVIGHWRRDPWSLKILRKIITHTQNQFWESVIDAIYLGIDLMNVQTGEQ